MFGYLSALLSASLALSMIGNFIQHKDSEVLQTHLDTANASIEAYATSNKTKDDAITVLGNKLGEIAGQKQQVELARDLALAAQADSRDKLAQAAARVKTLRSLIYAKDVASRTWAFSPVPPALTGQLCEQWAAARGDDGSGCGRASSTVRVDSGAAAGDTAAGSAADAGVLPADCSAGCFSNDQLRSALDSALNWGGQCVAQLRAIGELSRTAVEVTKP